MPNADLTDYLENTRRDSNQLLKLRSAESLSWWSKNNSVHGWLQLALMANTLVYLCLIFGCLLTFINSCVLVCCCVAIPFHGFLGIFSYILGFITVHMATSNIQPADYEYLRIKTVVKWRWCRITQTADGFVVDLSPDFYFLSQCWMLLRTLQRQRKFKEIV